VILLRRSAPILHLQQKSAARKNKVLKNVINKTLLNDDDELLNSVSLEQIRRYARRSWRFLDAYRKGLTGIAGFLKM
jgi:hypothetical protein